MPEARLNAAQRGVLVALLLGWLGVVIGGRVVAPAMLGAAYDGESIAWLNQKIEKHRAYRAGAGLESDREWYLNWARGYALKAAALATLGAGVVAALVAWPAARRRVKRYLLASSAPLNLAVLRVAAFGMLLYLLRTEKILYYAAWPREMYDWPAVAGLYYKFLPITPEVVGPLLTVALVTTCLTMVGLFTRVSAIVSVLLAVYLIGVPQLSGKVNHLHHVVLICAVLACSRCGDALSLDAVWRALRRADQGIVAPPRRGVRYGLPIRVAMLVLATVYFFPGFWKIASNGPQWVFSDNLTNHMYQKWFELEHYTPPIPLHKAPFAGPGGALFAVVFELGFPLALLWRPTRALWGVLGITFHNLTNLLMQISFITLQTMYVMFVDWQRLFRWIGNRLFGEPLRVLYDGNCGLCRRTMAVLGVFDWLQSLRPVNALDRAAVEAECLGELDDAVLMQDMHTAWRGAGGWGVAKGYAAYQTIAWRVPLLWPLLPVLYLPPVAAIGQRIYRRVADSRACRVPSAPKGAATAARSPFAWSWKPLALVGGGILAGQCLLGAGRLHTAWPIACYPLFDQIEDRTVVWPEFTLVNSAGEETVLDDDPIRDHLGSARYVVSMKSLVAVPLDPEATELTLKKFVEAWRADGVLPEDESRVERLILSRATYELSGPERPETPVESQPHHTVAWSAIAKEE